MTKVFLISAIAIIALGGALAVFAATHLGIGISPDSVYYIGGARSLLDGEGFRHPLGDLISHYPPFYPLLLSAISIFGHDPIVMSRWLNAMIFAANIFLTGVIIFRLLEEKSSSATWLSVVGAILVASSIGMLEIHTMAWTEPLYLLLQLVGLVLLTWYFDQQNIILLLLAGLFIGLALLTRYAGVAIIGTGMVGLILLSKMSFRKRITALIVFTLASLLPMVTWVLRNYIFTGTTANRDFVFHSLNRAHFWEALTTVSSWALIPISSPTLIKLVPLILVFMFVGGVILILILQARSEHRKSLVAGIPDFPNLIWLFVILIPLYIGTLLFTNMFLNTYTPLDRRILSPIYIPIVILVLYFVGIFYHHMRERQFSKILTGGFLIGFTCLHILFGYQYFATIYQTGLGFNASIWFKSETLNAIQQLPDGINYYSNAPEALYIHTNHPTNKIPQAVRVVDQNPNENYERDVQSLETAISSGPVAIVVFNLPGRSSEETYATLLNSLPIQSTIRTEDGVIYLNSFPP
jgi:4-amino-4-deoxy-L-arabinose transferase-like glycosyltransferase